MPDTTALEPVSEARSIGYRDGLGRERTVVKTFREFTRDFPLEPRYDNLHSLLRNTKYFAEALEALTAEIQDIIEDRIHVKAVASDPAYFTTYPEYDQQLRNMSSKLNHEPDYFLLPLLFENERSEITTEWKKFDVESIPFSHRFRVSAYAYVGIFSRIWRHGGIYLDVLYPEGRLNLNEYTGKSVRLVNNDTAISEFLPPSSEFWPSIGYITGVSSYDNFAELFGFRYDIGSQNHDRGYSFSGEVLEGDNTYNIEGEPELHFDGDIYPLVDDAKGAALILSLTLDRVLSFHTNTLARLNLDGADIPYCLQDIHLLQYIERQAWLNKRTLDNVRVGSQLTLACDTSGFFVKGADSQYSFPDILTNTTVIAPNWNANNTPRRVRLGTGAPSGRLADILFQKPGDFQKRAVWGTASAYDESVYNEGDSQYTEVSGGEAAEGVDATLQSFNMVNPVFSTVLGDYETPEIVSNLTTINTLIERQALEGLSQTFAFRSPEDDADSETEPPNDAVTSIPLSHEYIAPGTLEVLLALDSLYIRIGAKRVLANTPLSLSIADMTNEAFLFDPRIEEPPYNIMDRILYDYMHLRYFGDTTSEGDELNPYDDAEPLIAIQAALVELADHLDVHTNNLWIFDSLRPSREEPSLRDVLIANKDDGDILSHVIAFFDSEYLGDPLEFSTAGIPFVDAWLNRVQRFEFIPVGDYVDGKATPVEGDFFDNAKLNCIGRAWQFVNWYSYAPIYTWRVYGKLYEEVDAATGWKPKGHHMIFSDQVFRNALRFYGYEDTSFMTPDTFPTAELFEIIQDFTRTLSNGELYANTPYNTEEYVLEPPYDQFFEPAQGMGAGGMIPACVQHNHRFISEEWSYEGQPVYGPILDIDNGVVRFNTESQTSKTAYVPYVDSIAERTITKRLFNSTEDVAAQIKYIVNTTKNYANPNDTVSQIVAIRELGIFNTEDQLIAYATFPPIIYDSEKNHVAVNFYISETEFTYP